jgi:hypothetical protein
MKMTAHEGPHRQERSCGCGVRKGTIKHLKDFPIRQEESEQVMLNKPLAVVWSDYGHTYERQVENVVEALELAHHVATTTGVNAPTVVEFFEPSTGLALDLALGRSETVVGFQYDLDPPYFQSLGDPNRLGVIPFCHGNTEIEFSEMNAVPLHKGLEALAFFVENRTRPENLEWETL